MMSIAKPVPLTDKYERNHPLAIAMWDFSWLERRWPGAGYEDWDRTLDELAERGYDAVRIDAYPHLVAAGPQDEWNLLPPWRYHDWGSPVPITVRRILPHLLDFIEKCASRKILVALSTWFQDDTTHRRTPLASPGAHAHVWIETLQAIERAGLLSQIYYVDFCNEWPLKVWAPFFHDGKQSEDWRTEKSLRWMKESIARFKAIYPHIPCTFSLTTNLEQESLSNVCVDFLDFLEPHRWLSQATDFSDRLTCGVPVPAEEHYEKIVPRALLLYRSDEEYWKRRFQVELDALAHWGASACRPLVTTEGWCMVEYKDWPGLEWGWIKDFNAWTVDYCAATGRWAALCTSNFCGPQFRGMWNDVAWHQARTQVIHNSKLPPS
jgi:hypothetical protein